MTKAGTGYTGAIRFVYGEDGKLLGEYSNTGALITNYPYTYAANSNKLTAIAGPAARSYTFDASGNVATTSTNYNFGYDARGRMTAISGAKANCEFRRESVHDSAAWGSTVPADAGPRGGLGPLRSGITLRSFCPFDGSDGGTNEVIHAQDSRST